MKARAGRVAVLALGILGVLPAAPAHAAPAIDLDRDTVKPGQTVTVRLTGWDPGNLLVELCGNEARRGTADCAVASSATTHVREGEAATVLLNVTAPPVGCPCVISVRPVTGGTPRTVPITVTDVPVLSPSQRRTATAAGADRQITATKVTVRGGGFGESWFGGTAHRTLRVTLLNEGDAPLTDPPLSLTAGRGSEPADLVTAPALGTLAPGEERTYEIPVSLPAPAFGRYTIRGEITGVDEPIAFTATTSSYPWALPVLAALLIPLPALTRRRPPARGTALDAGTVRPATSFTMNQTVAANVAWWSRIRELPPESVADSLASLTGRPRTPADLASANPVCSFDADDLQALSQILDIPLPALLLPAPAPDKPESPPKPARRTKDAPRPPEKSTPTVPLPIRPDQSAK
ncbi:hypothetical protein SAMN04489712_111136 [Thermomonospora echinospora]|uniref:Uncharacterized protein n=1 Tax=Thermomonospora echinospora TaxID=1992 RepID=A0A1H6CT37_9ACTN|nr:hypothetical protein [Thermomonospora echinospora]SEG76209.1 hypothetical protein SAMN04489712_111136 [Thermomonospora echinospora]